MILIPTSKQSSLLIEENNWISLNFFEKTENLHHQFFLDKSEKEIYRFMYIPRCMNKISDCVWNPYGSVGIWEVEDILASNLLFDLYISLLAYIVLDFYDTFLLAAG